MKTSETKKNAIKQGIKNTREKRVFQICKVFELKINGSNLNKIEKEQLKMFFVEAKWLYNYILNQEDIFKFDYKTKEIEVMNKFKELESRTLKFLPAKNRQDVFHLLKQNIISLSRAKKKGLKVGKLKFKKDYRSIDLSQNGVTHSIISKNRIRVNGIKRPLLVRGLQQIKKEYEVANAKLIKKPDGYYIKITCYFFPKGEEKTKKQNFIGIDFGIKTAITTSNGEKFNMTIAEPDSLKRLQCRILRRSKKGSNNRHKLSQKLQREYQKLDNKKQDAANKIVHSLLFNNGLVFMQDENLKGWHKGLFGKQVQHSCLGRIKKKLLESKQIRVIDKFAPTTKCCYNCGKINEIDLSEKIYICSCGLVEDRDIKAAKTILKFGLIKEQIPTEYREFKPVEKKPLLLSSEKSKYFLMKQEARDFSRG